jgi:methionyl-tRNA formyltransferase
MKINILNDNPKSWVISYITPLLEKLKIHTVRHILSIEDIDHGDIMFILSSEKILKKASLSYHKNNIVVHPSKLPLGKGWSPLAWQILEGHNRIPVTLFEAVESVDAGKVYLVDYIHLIGNELNEEIKDKQGQIMIKMISEFVEKYGLINGIEQSGEETIFRKRSRNDNKLDVDKSIRDQFNLLRIVDNERYPAFFELHGKTFILKIFDEKKSI